MAADLYDAYPVARETLDQADAELGFALTPLMFNGPLASLTLTAHAQPAILAHSVALLRVLQHTFGLQTRRFGYALGHSLGEYAALVATGALDYADALRLVRARGVAMQEATGIARAQSPGGETAMRAFVVPRSPPGQTEARITAITAEVARVQAALPRGDIVEVANVNSGTQIVLAGTLDGVLAAGSALQTRGFAGRCVALPVSSPFHCTLMQPAAEAMRGHLRHVRLREPATDVLSNMTGMPYRSVDDIRDGLAAQVTGTVQWYRSMLYARDDRVHEWAVIGPSRVLFNLLRKEFPEDKVWPIATAADLLRHGEALARSSEALAL
ncbi:hypothetical protein CXG81DRAFT_21389 [Caulochytrium protostelioides]|uniref:[acyl-carrier-protein] S-malonyltransferase n=1 Tax=Caulochytrium protostelioides TaxID=1555241 RepID=A0A4P9X065_9FUNG|nr:FabD/lysophospholipase-like protein [Caulochytrium protostelioides]RKO98365.1 hypothetical protein CXG81DRAFT_21389 [Caulochytrium protostelioides]|eukprot:RKO98365.1 hypothetical protein CXG81DRAFT_21389 [Caulochytrium protostelioides]